MAGKRANGESSYRRRENGTWEARSTVYGERKSFYGKTQAEVKAKVKEAERRQEIGIQVATKPERQTLSVWLDSWLLRVKPTIRESTWSRYGSLLEHVKRLIGRVPLAKVTAQHVEELYATLLEQGLSSTTVHHARPKQSSFRSSAEIPGPSRCAMGLFAKNCGTKYSRRLLKPNPFKIIATTAVPTLTRSCVCSSRASNHSATPISRQTPATMPK
jgi:integrase